jgi:hypothetical protein
MMGPRPTIRYDGPKANQDDCTHIDCTHTIYTKLAELCGHNSSPARENDTHGTVSNTFLTCQGVRAPSMHDEV